MKDSVLNRRSYFAGIDGLRAIAVLAVLLYHFDHRLLPGGFTGVDIFFVISGYVISKSLAETAGAGVKDFLLGFYKRRILRIAPALVAVLTVTSLASVLFIPNDWLSGPNKRTAITAFFGISNIYLVTSADGYFSTRIPFNPFAHTWSLAVEEQFYVFYPLIFYGWLRLRACGARLGLLASLALACIAIASLSFAAIETGTS